MAYRVYLVDDDRFLLDLYAVKFRAAGHEVSVFSGGEELLAALRKEGAPAPDVILLDIIMPGVGGFEALEAIRKEHLAQGTKSSFFQIKVRIPILKMRNGSPPMAIS